MKLYSKTVSELRNMLDQRDISSLELVESFLQRIEEVEGQVHAYVTVQAEEARAQAKEADRRLAAGENVGPLTGIPIGLKDNITTAGTPTTAASKMLETFVPPYDATVVAKLKAAGAPILGKLNMDEFAMGSSTETSAFGVTRNPWDLSRVPGGSSGGSAAAVAADMAPLTLGSDTGGSIRQPAAFCGTVGLKPTNGLVSRYGLIPLASSLDQIGPLTKTVKDSALCLQVIAGGDRMDSTSVHRDVPDYIKELDGGVKGLVVGLPKEFFEVGLHEDVRAAVLKAVDLLESQGARIKEVSMPHARYALAAYCIIGPAEASSNLGRYDGVRYGYRSESASDVNTMFQQSRGEGLGAEVKRRIMIGTHVLSADCYEDYYVRALKVRSLVRQDFDKVFSKVDLLASPTTATTAFGLGERADDVLEMYQSDLCTVTANLAGVPAISVPCGLDGSGLPIGFQMFGPALSEALLLRAAYTYEQEAGLTPFKPQMEVV